MKRIFCAICVSLIGWQAVAGEVDDNLKKLEAALQNVPKQQGKNTEESEDSPTRGRPNLSYVLTSLRENIARNDLNSTIQMLQQMSSSQAIPAEAQKAIQELLSSLSKEQEERDKAVTDRFEQALKHASEAVKTAKTAADLDAVLTELGSLKNRQEYRPSEKIQAARNKLDPTYRFVSRWQDYLAAQAAGNSENCRNILRDLANSDVLLMPRSELLAKAQEPARAGAAAGKSAEEIADELVAKTKSLDGVSDLIKELRKLDDQRRQENRNSNNSLQPLIQSLEQINRTYLEYQTGLATNLDISTNNNPASPSVIPLKTQLILLVLPRYIGAPANVKPKAGEGVTEFLNRVAEEAKARGDFGLVTRSREALRQMQRTLSWSQSDTQALSKFQGAQNQEAAGQYMLAVISYQEALKSGSDIVPVKLIGERLADIQKKHPEDFEKGMERFLNPPQYNPMNRFPMGMPGRPEPTPEAPKLVIPAPTPAPSGVATPISQPSPAK